MELQHSQSKHLDGTFSGNAGDEGEIEVWGADIVKKCMSHNTLVVLA
jgi:hypothetical protein